ncbi:MAG: hypothetical protein R3C05_27140 [Pirellulaceae bacterium]
MVGTAFLCLLSVLSSSIPNTSSTDERVDLIELNHFFDENGRHVFDQVIFYQWSTTHHRYHVQAWRLVKDSSQLPKQSWKPSGYRCVWYDEGTLRTVFASAFRETWTQIDPERSNRQLLPQDQRTGLSKPMIDMLRKTNSPRQVAEVADAETTVR